MNALKEDFDTTKKTIIHIPNANSRESTKDKYDEVYKIIDIIGNVDDGLIDDVLCFVDTPDGRKLKVLDLVYEDGREKRQQYLRDHAEDADAVDIIIALNLAKEGFDWPPCEQMVTFGYRGSLTEIVQIIGRCTRDYPGKSEARFINIIAEPDAEEAEVVGAINNLLKAIMASLLMEQVLLPEWEYRAKLPKLQILEPESDEARRIIDEDLPALIEAVMTNQEVIDAMPRRNAGTLINRGLIPKIIMEKCPDLSERDREAIRQEVVTQRILPQKINEETGGNMASDVRLLHFANNLILDIRDLIINLIDRINPFEDAYQIISKHFDKATLLSIEGAINAKMHRTTTFSAEEIRIYWPQLLSFYKENGRAPDSHSENLLEAMLGSVLLFLQRIKREKENGKENQ